MSNGLATGISAGLGLGQAFTQGMKRRQKEFFELEERRKGALFQDARSVNTYLKAGQPQMALGVLSDRMGFIEQFGGDPRDTKEVVDLINSGDLQGATALLDSVEQAGIGAGYLKAPQGVNELDQVKLEKARLELEQMKTGEPSDDPEFLKEERKSARETIKNFNKRAGEIRSSYAKVESILNSGNLNRMKIASAMTSMARLLSPGIVTNQDFQNLSNSSNPIATLFSKLTEKGETGAGVAAELQRFYDPTNPDLFDKQSFLQTAKNVAGAEIPSLIDVFNQAQERAGRAKISKRAVDTFFTDNKNLKALQSLIKEPVIKHPVLGDVTEAQIQEAMKNKNLTREQVLAQLRG